MNPRSAPARDVDAYLATFPEATRLVLETVRRTIRKAAPGAVEKISYGIPAYALSGIVVYFAGYAKHVGLYPAPTGNAAFERAIARYRSGKATLRFPLDEPLPLDLIAEAVRLRVEANRGAAAAKAKKKTKKQG